MSEKNSKSSLSQFSLIDLLQLKKVLAQRATDIGEDRHSNLVRRIEAEIEYRNTLLMAQAVDAIEPCAPQIAPISDNIKIQKPPAYGLASAAKFILSTAAYQRYIYPHVEDIRFEYYEALQAGELRKARWIVMRGYCQALWPLVVAAWATLTALLKLST